MQSPGMNRNRSLQDTEAGNRLTPPVAGSSVGCGIICFVNFSD